MQSLLTVLWLVTVSGPSVIWRIIGQKSNDGQPTAYWRQYPKVSNSGTNVHS